ncbi:MAG: double-strand break repair helicase AddA [Alphaproteobacteria bacterium]
MKDFSLQNQKDATNPNYSVWVSASAGTGKTTVLVSRLLRLFLSNVDPTKILCLTYTNAGAIEMQDRIFKRARSWSVISDEELELEIKNLFTTDIDNFDFSNINIDELKITARKLFSKLIDNPIPLKIYTIHAFCQSVLKRFPIEANISPHFKIIEPIDASRLLKEAYKQFLLKIRNKQNQDDINLLNQFELLTKNLSQTVFEDLIENIISDREKFNNLLDIYKTKENIKKSLWKKTFAPYENEKIYDNEETLLNNFIEKIPTDILQNYLSVLEKSKSKSAPQTHKTLSDFLALSTVTDKVKNIDNYKAIFLTDKNTVRKTLLVKDDAIKNPQLETYLIKEAERIKTTFEIIGCIKVYNLTIAVIDIALELMNTYKSLKEKEGVMDFSDLIETVEHLFKKPNISEWILYKMDGGISHILIDEAQDTSPIQWDIVDTLTEQFFTTARDEKNMKSIFSVGDRKQSIFGFQGADISLFEKYKKHFKERVESDGFVFKDLPLNRSFRSCKNILNLVDDVLNTSERVKGVLLANEEIEHIPHREDFDGYVELIPLAKAKKDESEDYIKPPVEVVHISNAKINISDIVAKKIRHILDNDFISTGKNSKRKVEAKDIMILVQKRDNSKYLIEKLNEYNIPFSGQDKLNLSENIVVEDLISLIKFTLSPYDDLSLAEVLKSPLYNLTDDDLFTLCYNRKTILFEELKSHKNYEKIYEELSELIELSRIQTPFLFFDYVLKVKDKRKKFISRFGDVVNDILNEFIQKCLYYDKEKMGKSMFDFLSWFTSSKIEVKRDMEQTGNCVRIMTVHGSKGLEAPIVFLFDANVNDANLKDKILWNDNLPMVKTNNFQNINDYFAKIYNNQKQLNEDEFYRLLYVAMTRARDKLYISGWEDLKGEHTKSWYSCIKEVMEKEANKTTDKILTLAGKEIIDDEILSIGNPNIQTDTIDNQQQNKDAKFTIPEYFYNRENENAFSKNDISATSPLTPINKEETSLKKGSIIHKLLENFKGKNIENFKTSALKYLEKMGLDDKEKIITQIENILTNPDFDFMFKNNTFAELEVAIENKTYRIDKLVINDDEILIIDYKTDAHIPNKDDVPMTYKLQLANYKKVIGKIYPQYKIRTFILWFETATLMEII